jgi:cation:H+ antiporter
MTVQWICLFAASVAVICLGAEAFAEHLGVASVRLGVSAFAMAPLVAGAEPEELATVIAAAVKGAPGIVRGDVIGANVRICLVALGVGAIVAPLSFRGAVMRYAVFGLPIGVAAAWIAWDGAVSRAQGVFLVGLYALYVAVIWIAERRPPILGETAEVEDSREKALKFEASGRVGRELLLVPAGVAAMAGGGWLLVEAIIRITGIEESSASRSSASPRPLGSWS